MIEAGSALTPSRGPAPHRQSQQQASVPRLGRPRPLPVLGEDALARLGLGTTVSYAGERVRAIRRVVKRASMR